MHFVTQSCLLVAVMLVMTGCAVLHGEPGTALAAAAHHGDVAAVRKLIAGGADVNALGPDGRTALHWAVRGGHPIGPHDCVKETDQRLLVVAALLDAGADPDMVDRRPRMPPVPASGWTPLIMALRHEQFETAALLLERGADPNILTRQGRSALATASDERAPKELLQLLLARGFDAQLARRPDRP